ncbi:Eisosomes component [Rhizina undulata]
MIAGRPICALLGLFFLAGTIVLLFFLILAGAYDRTPLNEIFFLQADTSGIPNAPNGICHWTLYNFCEQRNGLNYNCRPNNAAYPFLPQKNFNTEKNVPSDFIDHPGRYFYLSRFLYSFYIIGVFFAVVALFIGLLATVSKLGGAAAAAMTVVALFCVTFSATIMTACFVMGQHAFQNAGRFARVGVKAFAFTWTCVALLFLANIAFCISYIGDRRKERSKYAINGAAEPLPSRGRFAVMKTAFKGGGYNGKRRSRASDESQRGLNKEYGLKAPASSP